MDEDARTSWHGSRERATNFVSSGGKRGGTENQEREGKDADRGGVGGGGGSDEEKKVSTYPVFFSHMTFAPLLSVFG